MFHSPAPAPFPQFNFAASSTAQAPSNVFAASWQQGAGGPLPSHSDQLPAQHASIFHSPAPASLPQVNEAVVRSAAFSVETDQDFEHVELSEGEESHAAETGDGSNYVDPSAQVSATCTFNSLRACNGHDYCGDAPGFHTQSSARGSSQRTESPHSQVSKPEFESEGGQSQGLLPKKMKATSKAAQFYTTIVAKICCYVKEYHGFVSTHRRSSITFRKVECALRDRTLYPLPADVKLTDLLAFSFFTGSGGDSEFKKFCDSGDSSATLTDAMISFADRLFSNKFTEVRKNIVNGVIHRFDAILKKITGDGKKSGQDSQHSFCFLHLLKHFSGTTRAPKIFWKMQIDNCMR